MQTLICALAWARPSPYVRPPLKAQPQIDDVRVTGDHKHSSGVEVDVHERIERSRRGRLV